MTETLNISAEGTPPKKRVQKIKEETPTKESFAGSKSQEVSYLKIYQFNSQHICTATNT